MACATEVTGYYLNFKCMVGVITQNLPRSQVGTYVHDQLVVVAKLIESIYDYFTTQVSDHINICSSKCLLISFIPGEVHL